MIYRGPDLLAVVNDLTSSPPPPPSPLSRQQVVSISQTSCLSPVELADGGGAKAYFIEKAWSSINH
jgi:hypothetical protein